MKVLIFGGSGKIGSAVAYDLIQDPAITQIGLAGNDQASLDKIANWLQNSKITTHCLDVNQTEQTAALLKGYQVAVSAVPDRRTSYNIARCAIESRVDLVDMLEEYHRRPDKHETEGIQIPTGMSLDDYGDYLHETAISNQVTFIDGMGFAPGLANATISHGISQLDIAQTAVARVGGIPSPQAAGNHPLRYMITWAFEHVLREYMIKVQIRRNGQITEIDASSELEAFDFIRNDVKHLLECAITPGMPSLIYTRPQLQECLEKTVRWPGHWQGVLALKKTGLLDLEPYTFNDSQIVSREFTLSLLAPKLQPKEGETDICVMYNTITGLKNNTPTHIEYHLWAEADPDANLSAMQRVTGFSVASLARMLLKKQIEQTGIVAPEDALPGSLFDQYIADLSARDILVKQTIKPV
ncbi:MAG TPA: saccharopine dehydrogenase [Candidatus Wirthbacteria bacterium]|nr:saccharopine dehydrogenase [Candidatus Wirthbacteria bacterium]